MKKIKYPYIEVKKFRKKTEYRIVEKKEGMFSVDLDIGQYLEKFIDDGIISGFIPIEFTVKKPNRLERFFGVTYEEKKKNRIYKIKELIKDYYELEPFEIEKMEV